MRGEREGLHDEIENPICSKPLHVLTEVPLLRCFVHQKQLPRALGNSKDQEHSTENESQNHIIQVC